MQFAPIMPLSLQEQVSHVMGEYHLLLAHKILEQPERYYDYYEARRDQEIDDFVILDNSVIELGHSLPADDLIQAARIVHANCVVLPDVLGHGPNTVVAGLRGAAEVGDLPTGMSWMIVLQGNSIGELLSCGTLLIKQIPNIGYISVPRIVTNKNEGHSRIPYVQAVRRYLPDDLPIHLLGFSDYLHDDVRSACQPGVIGIDSALPVWFGMQGGGLPTVLQTGPLNYGKRPPNFWEYNAPETNLLVSTNIATVREWIRLCHIEEATELP